jgi:hypothetical protein
MEDIIKRIICCPGIDNVHIVTSTASEGPLVQVTERLPLDSHVIQT